MHVSKHFDTLVSINVIVSIQYYVVKTPPFASRCIYLRFGVDKNVGFKRRKDKTMVNLLVAVFLTLGFYLPGALTSQIKHLQNLEFSFGHCQWVLQL